MYLSRIVSGILKIFSYCCIGIVPRIGASYTSTLLMHLFLPDFEKLCSTTILSELIINSIHTPLKNFFCFLKNKKLLFIIVAKWSSINTFFLQPDLGELVSLFQFFNYLKLFIGRPFSCTYTKWGQYDSW
jgi:hypothetical protein